MVLDLIELMPGRGNKHYTHTHIQFKYIHSAFHLMEEKNRVLGNTWA